jgi:hypothetical protein
MGVKEAFSGGSRTVSVLHALRPGTLDIARVLEGGDVLLGEVGVASKDDQPVYGWLVRGREHHCADGTIRPPHHSVFLVAKSLHECGSIVGVPLIKIEREGALGRLRLSVAARVVRHHLACVSEVPELRRKVCLCGAHCARHAEERQPRAAVCAVEDVYPSAHADLAAGAWH